MEEGGRIEGTGTAIEDVVAVGPRARKDFYGQRFWVCDLLEWPRSGAGSLNEVSGEWGVSLREKDEPRALEKERKRASTQGNNILGERKKETKARLYSEVWDERFLDDGTGTCRGLATGGTARDKWRTACGMRERRERKDRVSRPKAGQKRTLRTSA